MGFVMIDRSITDDEFFLKKPMCRLGFITYLHSIAIYKPQWREFNGVDIWLEKGDVGMSLRSLARRSGWDKERVRTFIKRLEKRGTLQTRTQTPVTVVSICKLRENHEVPDSNPDTLQAPTQAEASHNLIREEYNKEIINNKTKTNLREAGSATSLEVTKKVIRFVKEAEAVFDHWKLTWDSPRSIFDDKRKKIVKSALKAGHSVEDLKEAIEGMHNCPHNLGQNDQGVVYNRIGIVLKDADSIDRFRRMYETPPIPNTGGMTIDQSIADGMATAKRIMEHQKRMEEHEYMITDQNNNNKIGETYDNSEGGTE